MANGNARRLRTQATPHERQLWNRIRLKQLGHRFRRQHPIDPFIVDFVCLERRLVIELDGGQHGEDANFRRDERRTAFLEDQKFKVLRFWNFEVTGNLDGVVEAIWAALQHE
jgi:very-short-patch-repair endonuclease